MPQREGWPPEEKEKPVKVEMGSEKTGQMSFTLTPKNITRAGFDTGEGKETFVVAVEKSLPKLNEMRASKGEKPFEQLDGDERHEVEKQLLRTYVAFKENPENTQKYSQMVAEAKARYYTGPKRGEREETFVREGTTRVALQQLMDEVEGTSAKIAEAEAREKLTREKFIENYTLGEPPFAVSQREMLGLNAEQYLIHKGLLSGEKPSMSTLVSNFSKWEGPIRRAQRELAGYPKVEEWLEVQGMIPLSDDRVEIIENFIARESPMARERRKAAGISEEQFLEKMGVLPKQEDIDAWIVSDPEVQEQFMQMVEEAYEKAKKESVETIA